MRLLGLSFVHPAILGGLALASLPIIIHILNRRRFKTMDWAAMEFLLKAAVRNRRRVRLENLLLLLLRTLLVILLVMAVARPFSKREDALASLFGSEGATERIVLLDDSHSMHAGQGNKPAFQTAKGLVKRLVKRLHDERSSDRVSIVLASRPRQGAEGLVRVTAASAQHERMLRALAALRAGDGVFDVKASVDAILDNVREKEARVVLHVVSDFRRRDWTEADGALRPDIVQALKRFGERGEVRLLDVGAAQVQNVGVVDLRPAERAVIAGVPATFVATVRNHGPDPVTNPQVTFRFGQTALNERIETTLQPYEEAEVKKEYTFRAAGPAVVTASTPTDVLPGDDTRRRVIDVRRSMRFLLVDGEPEAEDYRGETDFLAAALMPPGKTESGIEVEVVGEHSFSGRELDAYDGVFLCNVYRLPDDRVTRLEEYVAAGGGLVFFVGDQVDPQVYNATFFGRGDEAGEKLLPLRLREAEGSSDAFIGLQAPSDAHPVTRFLRGLNQIVFRMVHVSRWISGDAPTRADTRVVLSFADEAGSPALAEKSFGEGRVLLFLTAADLEWSNLPHWPVFLPLVQECARYVVKADGDDTTLPVGTPLVIHYDPRRITPQVSVTPPTGGPVRLSSTPDPETKQLFFRYERTHAAGVYKVQLRSPEGEDFAQPYAFNVDPGEGDLRRTDLNSLTRELPSIRIERAGDESAFDTEDSDRSEFWRTLVYCLIAVAAVETLLAWRFGHHKARRLETEGKQVFVR